MALSKEEIAARYGTALFDYAHDMGALDDVYADLQELRQAISNNPQILDVFSDPIFDSEEKKESLDCIKDGLVKEVQNFLDLLLDYNHFMELPAIIDCFNDLFNQNRKVVTGIAISAVKLDDEQLKAIGDSFAQKYGLNNVTLTNKVDESIIGGVILKIGDCVVDGSIKRKLNKIRAQLVRKD
jgi:F-type H+-transporting ATPase subunit delta